MKNKCRLTAARARGRKGGRPRMNPKVLDNALRLYHSRTHSISEITNITEVSKAKLYQVLKERE